MKRIRWGENQPHKQVKRPRPAGGPKLVDGSYGLPPPDPEIASYYGKKSGCLGVLVLVLLFSAVVIAAGLATWTVAA